MIHQPGFERRQVHFDGHVQGVGFRYTTTAIARSFAVAGFVRNLADGRVEVVAEGERQELDAFLAEIRRRLGEYIRGTQTALASATGEFDGFGVRF
jgi:acylphosphatase